jgi:hypothetical protein
MNARLTLSLKVTSIRLTQTYAPTAVHAQMFARLKQFILNKARLPGINPEEKPFSLHFFCGLFYLP